MLGRLAKWLYRLVPHTCRWQGFTTEYGGGAKCSKCGYVGYVYKNPERRE